MIVFGSLLKIKSSPDEVLTFTSWRWSIPSLVHITYKLPSTYKLESFLAGVTDMREVSLSTVYQLKPTVGDRCRQTTFQIYNKVKKGRVKRPKSFGQLIFVRLFFTKCQIWSITFVRLFFPHKVTNLVN